MLQGDRNILLLVLFTVVIFIGVFLPSAQGAEPSSNKKEKVIIDCPVCTRVIRASRSLAKKDSSLTPSKALQQYCQLPQISVEDAKFCYDIDTIQMELKRLFDLGANDDRICRRVYSMNPHFCGGSSAKAGAKQSGIKKGEAEMNTEGESINENSEQPVDELIKKKAAVNRAISNSKIHTDSGTTRRGIIYI